MTLLYLSIASLVMALAVYLLAALLWPERFS